MIFVAVVGARFLIPLFIPRFPLPAILAALVIDAADQTIFQQFTDLNLDSYQGYDKALDIFYLTIAYVSTMRNWSNPVAFRVGRFLWYYRLVGVMIFELTDNRWVLLLFANTFEYFFIYWEMVRTSWNPMRIAKASVLTAMALIWIFIKLPQEYWLHVAQLDVTDFLKEDVFGVSVDATWGDALTNRPAVTALLLAVAIGLGMLAWFGAKRLPTRDWPFTFSSDRQNEHLGWDQMPAKGRWTEPVLGWASFEKVVLLSLVATIFSRTLPGVEANGLQFAVAVALLVVTNAAISLWRAKRELEWASTFGRFVVVSIVNVILINFYSWFASRGDAEVDFGPALFFALLISIILVLFDRYRKMRSARLFAMDQPDDASLFV
jgi:hypothetical protein